MHCSKVILPLSHIGCFFSCWHFILQYQEGVAEEEVWSEIWLPDHFTQYGEDAWAQLATKNSNSDHSVSVNGNLSK